MDARRPGWAAVAFLAAAACGGTTTKPEPKPPLVSLSPVPHEIVDTGFDVTVAVSGCEKVSRVWLTDGEAELVHQDGGSTSNVLTVKASYVDYKTHGIPAYLALFGHATCDTGLQGDSDEQATQFLPAQEVVAGPLPFGANFWVEEDAATALSCSGSTVMRVAKDKSVLASLTLPFACSGAAELVFGGDGRRYLLEPGVGVVGFTSALTQTFYVSETDFCIAQVLAPAGGPVVLLGVDGGCSGILYQLRGYDPDTSELVSTSDDSDQSPGGRLDYDASMGQVVFPGFKSQTGSDYVDVGIELYDMKAGRGGAAVADRTFAKIFVDPLSTTLVPTLTFDESVDTAYLAEISDPARVYACNASDNLTCTSAGGGLRWQSAPLPGGLTTVTRTADALVAWGPRVAYFLDPSTGAPLTSLDSPIIPRGSLRFVAVLGGGDGSTYLLAMGVDGGGDFETGVKEILLFDHPNQRVADYLTGSDGYIVDVDKTGRAWLWKYDLATLKMAADYRAALGN